MAASKLQHASGSTFTTTERPLDFIYDPINQTSSIRSYYRSSAVAHAQPQQLKYVPIYPYMFSGMPQFANGYYGYKDDIGYPHQMDPGYPKPPRPPEVGLETTVRGRDRWESYKRPHLPYYDGPIQYLDYQYPTLRINLELQDSIEPYGRDFIEQDTRNIGCQTDYRVQSAQTDPAELGVKLREAFRDFDTIYPKHCHPFTMKTMALVKRGLQRRNLREYFASDHATDDPAEQQRKFARLETEKWEFLGAEMQENMEDRMTAFKKSIGDSQNYLRHRIKQAKVTLEKNQAARFSAEMAVMWYDVNIWRRYYVWTKQFMKRKIAGWQINPSDVELLKQVSEAFAHDARRYVPRTNQGDVISDMTWNNRNDYFLDTWEGFSQVLQNMSPKHLQADIFLPLEESIYGAKGYVKRKFKETARFEKISFTLDDKDYGDSEADLTTKRTKKRCPALLRPMPLIKQQKPMLRVPPLDTEYQAVFRAGVTIQKIVRGRGMQKMIQTGVILRKELIDEVRGNVALTEKAKTEMKAKYEDLLRKGRVLLFYRYRARFIDSFLSAIEAQLGTRVLRDSHYTLVRHLEFEGVVRLKRFAETQRRMREAEEAGRRQQDYRRYAEKEESVQLFQLNHHVPAERAVLHAVKSAEAHMARVAAHVEEKSLWHNMMEAEKSMKSAMNQQEKETFIASMIYSVMIPDVQRTLIREKQNVVTESRRLAIHHALFDSIAKLNRKMKRRHADHPDDNDAGPDIDEPALPSTERNILPTITRPSHRLDIHSKSYSKYIRRREGLIRCLDTQYNHAAETQTTIPTSDLFYRRFKTSSTRANTELGLWRFQGIVDQVMQKTGGYTAIHKRSLLKQRRRPSVRQFDRTDQSTLRRILADRHEQLSRRQHEEVAEIFEERSDKPQAMVRAETGRLRRKRARSRARQLWLETQDWIQNQVTYHRQNKTRPYGLDPLQHDFQSPSANVTGESVSRYDMADVAKMAAVTLTVHTTGNPQDAVDDVVVINELVQTDYVPRALPEDEYIRARLVQAKLNG